MVLRPTLQESHALSLSAAVLACGFAATAAALKSRCTGMTGIVQGDGRSLSLQALTSGLAPAPGGGPTRDGVDD